MRCKTMECNTTTTLSFSCLSFMTPLNIVKLCHFIYLNTRAAYTANSSTMTELLEW